MVLVPNGAIGIFFAVILGSNQSLKEMSTRNISWGDKGGGCIGLTHLPLSCVVRLHFLEPKLPGNLRACTGLSVTTLTFFYTIVPLTALAFRRDIL